MKKLLLICSFTFSAFCVNAQKKLKYSPLPASKIGLEWFQKKIIEYQKKGIKVVCNINIPPKNEYDIGHYVLILKKQSVLLILFNVGGNSYIMKECAPPLKQGQDYEGYYTEYIYNGTHSSTEGYEALNHKNLYFYVKDM